MRDGEKNLHFIILENNFQESRKVTLQMTSVENGKKWGRVRGTLRGWVQGRERRAALQEALQVLAGEWGAH